MTPERTLLLVGLIGGLLFLAVTPPFQAPDEPHHFARAYQLSEGVLFPPAGRANLPASVLRAGEMWNALCFHTEERVDRGVLRDAFALPLDPARRVDGNIGGAALSTPAPYLPQALAALAGRELGLRPLAILYLCRLANLLASLAVAWTAVRIAPFFRWLFAFLALDPMALFLRSTASPDALIDAAALLLVAACLALAVRPAERPRAGLVALFVATVALLALAKGASYLLLPGLVLLIPLAGQPEKRPRALPLAALIALVSSVAVVSLAGAGLSGWAARRAYTPLRPEIGADLALQTAEILHHPVRFLGLAAVDAVRHAPIYAIQFVGNLGWLDTPLPAPVLLGYALLLLALALVDGAPHFALAAPGRLLVAGIAGGTFLAIAASQYLLWTPVGASYIDGIQGRYLLPLAPAAALFLLNRRWARDLDRFGAWLFATAALVTVVSLVRVGLRYYGG
jgi:uncharacterized membrane protein